MPAQPFRGGTIDLEAIALPAAAPPGAKCRGRIDVGHEPEPVEILEDGLFEGGPRALAVVVLDAQQDLVAEQPGGAPDRRRVQHVPQVQQTCGGRGEPGRHRRRVLP